MCPECADTGLRSPTATACECFVIHGTIYDAYLNRRRVPSCAEYASESSTFESRRTKRAFGGGSFDAAQTWGHNRCAAHLRDARLDQHASSRQCYNLL